MFSDIYINGIINAVKTFNSSEQSEFDFLVKKIDLLLSVDDITTDQADELTNELKLRHHTAKECYFGDGCHAHGGTFEHRVAETYNIPESMLESEDD